MALLALVACVHLLVQCTVLSSQNQPGDWGGGFFNRLDLSLFFYSLQISELARMDSCQQVFGNELLPENADRSWETSTEHRNNSYVNNSLNIYLKKLQKQLFFQQLCKINP